MPELSPQPSINDVRGRALAALAARLGALDLTQLLVYRIESCPDSALKWLAWQFDVLDASWQLLGGASGESIDALTDIDSLTDIDTLDSPGSVAGPSDWDSYRALIKAAIPLHRVRGTPYAVTTALAALGFPGATLLEGQNSWGGNSWPANEGWAVFRAMVPLAPGQSVTPAQIAAAIAAINFFKNERSWLDGLWLVFPALSDLLLPAPTDRIGGFDPLIPAPSDSFSYNFGNVTDTYAFVPTHNRRFRHAGITYAATPVGPSDGPATLNNVPTEGVK
ncbi:MAG: phage tail protein [Candidatus Binataceae bacterium]